MTLRIDTQSMMVESLMGLLEIQDYMGNFQEGQ